MCRDSNSQPSAFISTFATQTRRGGFTFGGKPRTCVFHTTARAPSYEQALAKLFQFGDQIAERRRQMVRIQNRRVSIMSHGLCPICSSVTVRRSNVQMPSEYARCTSPCSLGFQVFLSFRLSLHVSSYYYNGERSSVMTL